MDIFTKRYTEIIKKINNKNNIIKEQSEDHVLDDLENLGYIFDDQAECYVKNIGEIIISVSIDFNTGPFVTVASTNLTYWLVEAKDVENVYDLFDQASQRMDDFINVRNNGEIKTEFLSTLAKFTEHPVEMKQEDLEKEIAVDLTDGEFGKNIDAVKSDMEALAGSVL